MKTNQAWIASLVGFIGAILTSAYAGQNEIVYVGRVAERLIISLAGVLSIYFGYRLFFVVTESEARLSASGQAWRLSMSKIGPGVLFALFGAVLLIFSVTNRPEFQDDNGSYRGVVAPDATNGLDLSALQAILEIEDFAITTEGDPSEPDWKSILDRLQPLKARVVDSALGKGRYAEWNGLKIEQRDNPQRFTARLANEPDLRSRFDEVEELLGN